MLPSLVFRAFRPIVFGFVVVGWSGRRVCMGLVGFRCRRLRRFGWAGIFGVGSAGNVQRILYHSL